MLNYLPNLSFIAIVSYGQKYYFQATKTTQKPNILFYNYIIKVALHAFFAIVHKPRKSWEKVEKKRHERNKVGCDQGNKYSQIIRTQLEYSREQV